MVSPGPRKESETRQNGLSLSMCVCVCVCVCVCSFAARASLLPLHPHPHLHPHPRACIAEGKRTPAAAIKLVRVVFDERACCRQTARARAVKVGLALRVGAWHALEAVGRSLART